MSASTATEMQPLHVRGWLRRLLHANPLGSAIFLLTSFIYGVALFTILVTLLATGIGLSITLVGIPILALTLAIWVGAAIIERHRIQLFFGERIESPYRPRPVGTFWVKTKSVLKDPAIWKDLAYDFALFPIGIAELVILTIAVSFPFSMILAPIDVAVSGEATWFNWGDGNGWRVDTLPEALLLCFGGLLMLIPALALIVLTAWGHLRFAVWMLRASREEELEERVDVLTKTRSDVMDAMLAERRRIERDLHDGAQQRLVSLAINLGMAREKLETDPEAARALIETSHVETKLVLSDLRELVRGIHPAVLTDRGLDAAVSAIAGRSPIPVAVDIELPERLPEAVESTAYFIVSEALTNVAKHSHASKSRVTIWREADILTVLVWDDGIGGARLAPGSGLAGLANRVAALDGQMDIESPKDGGTTIRAEIPCGW